MHYEESYKSFNGEYLCDGVVSSLGLICALAAKGKHFIPFVHSETCVIRDLVSQMPKDVIIRCELYSTAPRLALRC